MSDKRLRAEAARLGFKAESTRRYHRREPGACVSEDWIEARLVCPCGRVKRLHLRVSSARHLRDHLRQHLIDDGLLQEHGADGVGGP